MISRIRSTIGGNRRRLLASAVATVLALGGGGAIAAGTVSQHNAPNPDQAAEHGTSTRQASGGAASSQHATRSSPASKQDTAKLSPSRPTSLAIPAIDVHSSLLREGQTADGSIEVPQPGPDYDKAAWYKNSPTPGERGPSVLLGHIDSAKNGPSVFFRLGALDDGDTVSVTRKDGTVAVFTVDRVKEYAKSQFPTLDVYGNTDDAQLRLITCGGDFNDKKDSYVDNTVVYAHLTGWHAAHGSR